MNATTSKDAIIAFLSTPTVVPYDIPASDAQEGRGQISTGGFGAKPETIRFIKERTLPHRELHFVTFENEQGLPIGFTCEMVEESDKTWHLRGGSGGGIGGRPRRLPPRANLGGIASSSNQFYAGGYVEPTGHSVARVQLVSANNVILEDTVDDDIVLFLDDRFIEFPMEARLYDAQEHS